MTGIASLAKGEAALGLVHRERQGCGKARKQFSHLKYITSRDLGQVSCGQAIAVYAKNLTGNSAKTQKLYWHALQEKEVQGHGV